MIILLMGAPGVGKGTQAELLASNLKVPHISIGELFRKIVNEQTEIGKKSNEYIKQGILVPDNITFEIINSRIAEEDCKGGFILEGFPRTIDQALGFEKLLNQMEKKIKVVFNLEINYSKLLERISGRRVCKSCGATYHTEFEKPKVSDICDVCGKELTQRQDDNEESFKNRMEVYITQTTPLISFYENQGHLINVNADDTKENIMKKLLKHLGVNA